MNQTEESSADPKRGTHLLALLGELESLLDREYDVIRTREIAQLDTLTNDKQALVDDIKRTAAAMGDGLKDLLGDDRASVTYGRAIRSAIARCAKANKTNGCAIESSQSFTSSLLDVLRGRAPGERTYTARGRLGASRSASAFVRV
jgi:flagellar biosynthesis/type III secretory pathway chaperone